MSNHFVGVVMQADNQFYTVNLDLKTCDCGYFLQNGILYRQSFSCIYELGKPPCDYVPEPFTIQTWKNTYVTNLTSITLTNRSEFVID